jgi:ABC-2 type transport system ATP-binding protein
MIEVQSLTKWYGPTLAVDNLSFSIPAGQVVGFLGPNGAGKSTTLRILTGYLPPTSGRATIDGRDVLTQPEAARQRLGYLPENTPLYPEMRVEEYLQYRGKLMKMDRSQRRQRIEVVTERCGLQKIRRRIIGHLSRGNRQRVGIAQALLHDPPVLILDEPTAGLDPNQIGEVRRLISELRGKHTILLSTHILPEVEKTADVVMIIANGRVVAQGPPDELRQRVGEGARVLVELKATPESVRKAFSAVPGVRSVEVEARDGWCRALVSPAASADPREALGQAALTNHWPIREIRHEVASLEQYFVQITADQARGAAQAVAS